MTARVRTPHVTRPLLGLLFAASVTLTACSTDTLLGPEGARPARVILTSSGPASLASLGDTARLSPRVLDAGGRPLDGVRLRWSVSRAGVVERDADGIYRAVGNGRVTIVAEVEVAETGVRPDGYWAGRIADSVTIEVRQRAARLALAPVDTVFPALGASRQLRAQVTDARGNQMLDEPPPLLWTSADPGVVAVDSAGVVRSLGEGAARVSVRAGELVGAATFSVRPRLPHTTCMVFTQRRAARQSCVTLDFFLRVREGAR